VVHLRNEAHCVGRPIVARAVAWYRGHRRHHGFSDDLRICLRAQQLRAHAHSRAGQLLALHSGVCPPVGAADRVALMTIPHLAKLHTEKLGLLPHIPDGGRIVPHLFQLPVSRRRPVLVQKFLRPLSDLFVHKIEQRVIDLVAATPATG